MTVSAALPAGDPAALLATVPFLSDVDPDDLADFARHCAVRHYAADEAIVRQGEFGHSMFVLAAGAVRITATDDAGTRLELGRLDQPGSFFGEVALLGRGVRSATVTADGPATLIEIEKNRFDRLARRHASVLAALERVYHARSISTYVRLHRYLGQLDEATLSALIDGAAMRKFARNDVVCRAGDPSDTVLLVKDGVLKMLRRRPDGRESILAYFNTHDAYGVHDPPSGRPADLVALGQAEVIFLPRGPFDQLAVSHPQIYERFGKDDMHRSAALRGAGLTVLSAADAFLQEGVEVESLLVIDLDRCVRCGNCVRACHDRHQFTRLDRRGPIFRRRKRVDSPEHQHLLIPTSCRHCRDPECMVGCPTGAIHRTPDGEVDINDNCIGCDNCARKCPYDNITMMPLPEDQQRDGVVKRAIKCNLCRGYAYSNCVYNCPRGAVLRVDPLRYFDELALVMEPEQVEAIEWARKRAEQAGTLGTKQQVLPRSTRFIKVSLAVFAVGLAGLIGAFLRSPAPRVGGSAWGLTFGVVATGCLAFAMLLGARKRMRTRALGHLEVWTQYHMVVGALGFVAALAHAGFRITGVFTTALLAVFAVEVATGIAGQVLYTVVPRLLTRLERHGLAKLIEDLLAEEIELSDGIAELVDRAPADVQALVRGPIAAASGTVRQRYRADYDPVAHVDRVRALLSAKLAAVPPAHAATVDRVLRDTNRLLDVRAQLRLHRAMKTWLIVHLAAAGALAVLVPVHIVAMLTVL